ncbi:MAG: SBBP repeat-containing protein [Methanomassiliicoccales archaeon]
MSISKTNKLAVILGSIVVVIMIIAILFITPPSGDDDADGETDETSTLEASAFLGATDFDGFRTVAVDQNGYIYAMGVTYGTGDVTTTGAYDRTSNASSDSEDIIIAKFSPDLSNLLACTFFGGDGREMGQSIAVGEDGTVYVAGRTTSSDLPTTEGSFLGDHTTGSIDDLFLSAFSNDLSSLVASTYVGTDATTPLCDLAIGNDGSVYLVGGVGGAVQNIPTTGFDIEFCAIGGEDDAVVLRFNDDLSEIVSATYLGGQDSDNARTVAISQSGDVYVAGYTFIENEHSTDRFPTTAGAYDQMATGDGKGDGFVCQLSPDLSELKASTLIGNTEDDSLAAMTLDPDGNVLVSGYSHGNFPTTEGAHNTVGNGNDIVGIVVKLDAGLTDLIASTYFGNSGTYALSLVCDPDGNVYISGTAGSIPTTDGGIMSSFGGYNSDLFLTKMSSDLQDVMLSTYIGGNGDEGEGRGLALSTDGSVVMVGWTKSTNFLLIEGAENNITEDAADGFAVKILIE